jgi:hypothetical protein
MIAAWIILGLVAVAAAWAWSSGSLSAAAVSSDDGDNLGIDTSLSDLASETGGANAGANPSAPVQAIATAIASAEGYGPPGNIPTKANNPGDLCLGDLGSGTITSSGGEKITVFPTSDAGWQALYSQVSLMCNNQSGNYNTGMTWAQIGAKYAGANTPWGQNVANALGVDVNSTLGDYLNA